jgi:hypothetical protein
VAPNNGGLYIRFVFALLAVCVTTAFAQPCGFMGQPPYVPGAPI